MGRATGLHYDTAGGAVDEDIPEHWIVRNVAAGEGRVTLTLLDGTVFQLYRRNVGPLSFDILDGGYDKSDLDLELIWRKYASAVAA